jgi:hypothetical protein
MHGDTTGEATIATVDADEGDKSGGARDIFEDVDVMKYLKDGEVKATWSNKEKDWVLQQAKRFVWEGTHLQRLWPDGTYQEDGANTGGQSEVDQACSRGPWTLWSTKDIQLASNSLLVAGNATTSSSLGGLMCGV